MLLCVQRDLEEDTAPHKVCVAVRWSLFHHVAWCCRVLRYVQKDLEEDTTSRKECVAACCSMLQCVAVFCTVLQCVKKQKTPRLAKSLLQCAAVCCSVLQCVQNIYKNQKQPRLRLTISLTRCYLFCANEPYQNMTLFEKRPNKISRAMALPQDVERDVFQNTLSCTTQTLHRSSCSALQRVAVCYSVLQCVSQGTCTKERWVAHHTPFTAAVQRVAVCCTILQCVAACCSVLQCVVVCCSVCDKGCVPKHAELLTTDPSLQRAVACCSVLQCVAVCCSVCSKGCVPKHVEPHATNPSASIPATPQSTNSTHEITPIQPCPYIHEPTQVTNNLDMTLFFCKSWIHESNPRTNTKRTHEHYTNPLTFTNPLRQPTDMTLLQIWERQ